MLQAEMECRGGLHVEEGAMMTTMELASIPSRGLARVTATVTVMVMATVRVAATHQQSTNAAGNNGMQGGADHGGGVMMTTTESMNVPLRGVGNL
jgi:hypothetical protein